MAFGDGGGSSSSRVPSPSPSVFLATGPSSTSLTRNVKRCGFSTTVRRLSSWRASTPTAVTQSRRHSTGQVLQGRFRPKDLGLRTNLLLYHHNYLFSLLLVTPHPSSIF